MKMRLDYNWALAVVCIVYIETLLLAVEYSNCAKQSSVYFKTVKQLQKKLRRVKK